ncbi:MAG: sarcosine oxidase subunit gamma, partial [Candidatus Puniceispirillaceae bacterium]
PNGGKPGLVFYEMAHLGKINLRTDKSAGKMVKAITGCAFPPAANKFTSAGERHAVWLGPDEFLVLCEAGKDEDLTRAIQTAILQSQISATRLPHFI